MPQRCSTKQKPKKLDDFESVAKRLECDPDKARFEAKLGKLAKAKNPAKRALMRLAVTICCALVVAAQTADAKPIWKAVPGHKGVFVDIRSIVHVDASQLAHRPCETGERGNALHPCWPSADTKANVKVDGAISKDTGFYCATPGIEVGDIHFGTVGGPEHVIPVNATRLVVCGAAK